MGDERRRTSLASLRAMLELITPRRWSEPAGQNFPASSSCLRMLRIFPLSRIVHSMRSYARSMALTSCFLTSAVRAALHTFIGFSSQAECLSFPRTMHVEFWYGQVGAESALSDSPFDSLEARRRCSSLFFVGLASLRVPLAFAQACAASLVRMAQRLPKRMFWRGHGELLDPAHGGLFTHFSVPRQVISELGVTSLQLQRVLGNSYPRSTHALTADWYYYVFTKPIEK